MTPTGPGGGWRHVMVAGLVDLPIRRGDMQSMQQPNMGLLGCTRGGG